MHQRLLMTLSLSFSPGRTDADLRPHHGSAERVRTTTLMNPLYSQRACGLVTNSFWPLSEGSTLLPTASARTG